MKKIFSIMALAVAVASCGNGNGNQEKVPALDLTNLDTSVSPAQDFYRYATGGWQEKNPLKPEYSRYGSFNVIEENNQKRINDLFKSMADMKTKPGTVEQKIADLYKMGLDSVKLNAEAGAPLQPMIARIQSVDTKEALVDLLAELHSKGESSFYDAGVMSDLMDSDMQILYLSQGGLGMGDRDYYLDPANAELKEGYRAFLVKVFNLSGIENAQAAADNAVKVEEALAEVSWTKVQEREIQNLYNPMSTAQVVAAYPALGLGRYFDGRNIPAQEKLIVCEPSFFEGLDKIITGTELATLKDYVLAQVINGACGALGDEYYTASWEFFSHQMSGAQEQKPRWKRAMSVPNSILGEAVGQMYVARYFPESSKKAMTELVKNLQIALGQHIDELDWMSDATKARAHEKLDNFTVKIGYPDKWKDYSSLEIDPEKSYYDNLAAASEWYVADNMSKLGQPTDRDEWGMSPQTVNAYYNPTTNEICFPAAILQPPFFNPDADEAVNYGGIGVVIGHEMSHGFDDQGRHFDKDGNMTNWWTEEDEARFNAKSEILVDQFNAVEILPGLMANGRFSLGENIGDHGGLSIAYSAMQNAIAGKNVQPIDGFTPEQRFFLSYGAIWAQNITDQEKERLTKLDEHSLAENRVNVSLKNFQQFFDAFGIKEGDAMYRPEEERVHIW